MTPEQLELLKYPIGKYSWPETITKETLDEWVVSISELPSKLEILVLSFSDEQLVHHIGQEAGLYDKWYIILWIVM